MTAASMERDISESRLLNYGPKQAQTIINQVSER